MIKKCKFRPLLTFLLLGITSSVLLAADKTDVSKIELDTEKMDKKYTAEPAFSSDSADQKDVALVIKKNEDKFASITVNHTEELFKCGKQGTVEAINKCKAAIFIEQKVEAKK